MNEQSDPATVVVCRQPQDFRTARFRVSDFHDPHWSSITGGVPRPTNRPYVFGYVQCDAALEGEIDHSCRHGRAPHTIKVCVTKTGNDPKVYQELARRADEREARRKLRPVTER